MIHQYAGVTFQQKSILDSPQGHYPVMGLKVYQYRWDHIPTGKSGTSEVACRNEHHLLALLNAWNATSDTWKYTQSLSVPHEWRGAR